MLHSRVIISRARILFLFLLLPFLAACDVLLPELNDPPEPRLKCRVCPDSENAEDRLLAEFSADESTDSDGEIVSYKWDFGDSTAGDGKVVIHTYPVKGVYFVKLTVIDDDGAAATAVPLRQVVPGDNEPPTARINVGKTEGTVPLSIAFDGSSSFDPNPGDSIQEHVWDFGDCSISSDCRSRKTSPDHTYRTPGTYTASLTVRDKFGETDTATVNIIANQ